MIWRMRCSSRRLSIHGRLDRFQTFRPTYKFQGRGSERLTGAKHVSTWKLAAFICYRKKLKGETEIVVSLVATKPWGLSKRSRRAAITELVRLGIVRVVDNGARQAPRVNSSYGMTRHGFQWGHKPP